MEPIDIKTWRQAMGWTPYRAAQELGASPSTWLRWERGETRIPPYLGLACAARSMGVEGLYDAEEGIIVSDPKIPVKIQTD